MGMACVKPGGKQGLRRSNTGRGETSGTQRCNQGQLPLAAVLNPNLKQSTDLGLKPRPP